MTDYTPTTDAIRGRIRARDGVGFWGLEEFDSWLAAHDAQKRAEPPTDEEADAAAQEFYQFSGGEGKLSNRELGITRQAWKAALRAAANARNESQ